MINKLVLMKRPDHVSTSEALEALFNTVSVAQQQGLVDVGDIVFACGWLTESDHPQFVSIVRALKVPEAAWVDFRRPNGEPYYSAWIGWNGRLLRSAIDVVAKQENQTSGQLIREEWVTQDEPGKTATVH